MNQAPFMVSRALSTTGNVVHGRPGGRSDGGHVRSLSVSPQPSLDSGPQPAGLPTGEIKIRCTKHTSASTEVFPSSVRGAQPMNADGSFLQQLPRGYTVGNPAACQRCIRRGSAATCCAQPTHRTRGPLLELLVKSIVQITATTMHVPVSSRPRHFSWRRLG